MLGAICGDIIGSTYEWHNVKSEAFELFPRGSRFTDDSVMTAAAADTLLYLYSLPGKVGGRERAEAYARHFKQYYARYPDAGFGHMFQEWAAEPSLRIQRSYANGAAMRVSPVAYAFETLDDVLKEAERTCDYTHNNKEAIAGAKAVAAAVFLARTGCSKAEIKSGVEKCSGYSLSFTLDSIRPAYVFDSRASYSVPPALVAFLESHDFESAVRRAISIGGDSDTIASIAGAVAQPFYGGIPQPIEDKCRFLLDSGLKRVVDEFCKRYGVR